MYTPSWVKIKYGAWYLNPQTWKKQEAGESLQDPKEQQNNILSEAKVKSQKLVRLNTHRTATVLHVTCITLGTSSFMVLLQMSSNYIWERIYENRIVTTPKTFDAPPRNVKRLLVITLTF